MNLYIIINYYYIISIYLKKQLLTDNCLIYHSKFNI